jgi:hypothetical protein
MKIIYRFEIKGFVLLLMFLGVATFVHAMDDPGFEINRMVVSQNIENREPVNSGDAFSASSKKLFCFLDARDIEQDTVVSFVWYLENQELARVELPLQQGRRWRTWSSKKINSLKGNWKVELQDSSGIIHNAISFLIE